MFRFVFVLLVALVSAQANASNYPPTYGDQTVRLLHKGPAIFAHVGSGMMDQEVFGYKNSGYLAQSNPDAIDAVVVASCMQYGSYVTKTSTVKLGREYHGTGYMSSGVSMYMLMPGQCDTYSVRRVEIAFSDGRGKWDSNFGANYTYGPEETYGPNNRAVVFETHEGGSQINLKAWAFIVDQMRK